jgi:hypothetical protein
VIPQVFIVQLDNLNKVVVLLNKVVVLFIDWLSCSLTGSVTLTRKSSGVLQTMSIFPEILPEKSVTRLASLGEHRTSPLQFSESLCQNHWGNCNSVRDVVA